MLRSQIVEQDNPPITMQWARAQLIATGTLADGKVLTGTSGSAFAWEDPAAPAANSIGNNELNAGDATNNQVLTAKVSGNTTTLDWTTPATGGTTLPTTGKADNKVLTATGSGANDNAWEDVPLPGDGTLVAAKLKATNTPTAGQIPSRAANGDFTWVDKGSGGGSFTAATQADVRAGTDNTKGVTSLAMSRFYDEMQRQIRNQWSSWGSGIETSNATLSNVITGAELHAATGNDSRTVTLAQGTPSVIPGTLSGLPANTRYSLTWQTGTTRYLMALDTSGNTTFYSLVSNAWTALGQEAMQFHPLTLPDSGDSYALADTASDHPGTSYKWAVSRGRRRVRAWRLSYAGGVYTITRRERSIRLRGYPALFGRSTAATDSICGVRQSQLPNANRSPYPLPNTG